MARKQVEAQVADLPTHTIPAVPEHLSMAAARKVAALKGVAALLVERDGRLVGVVDERALTESSDDVTVATVMEPIRLCLHPAMSVTRARHLFSLARMSILPVVVGAFLLGAIARHDVERPLLRRNIGEQGFAPSARRHSGARDAHVQLDAQIDRVLLDRQRG
jgi:CBS domain-containing protein